MSKGTSTINQHVNIAERFDIWTENLNLLRQSYNRIVPKNQSESKYPAERLDEYYLDTHLRYLLMENSTREDTCIVSQLKDGQDSNPRIQVPSTILKGLEKVNPTCFSNPERKKISLAWISCFLDGVFPDKNLKNWEQFELSHLCKNGLCVNHKHLWWESKSVNQSRGYNICLKLCNHENCEKRLCVCQKLHIPNCLN